MSWCATVSDLYIARNPFDNAVGIHCVDRVRISVKIDFHAAILPVGVMAISPRCVVAFVCRITWEGRQPPTVVYSSGTMRYALTSFANLLILLAGITIGIVLAPHIEKSVSANSGVQAAQTAPPPQVTPSNGVEQVQPAMQAGTVGFYLLLAHHTQTDELVVGGIDILKLEQGELNLLSRMPGVYPGQIQAIVDDARKDTHLYQVTAPKNAAPAPH